MGVLKNPRWERFAQELAKGKTADAAYEQVGFKKNRHNAARLAREEHIRTRVAELLAERDEMARKATEKAAEALSIDRQWVMSRLIENAQAASAAEDYGPSNKALELLGKELGMFIDRKQIDIDGELRSLSDAQLVALLAGGAEEGGDEEGDFPLTH
ncbi:hypothetical protein C4587_00730 [Candidatus Parcubacteria bacterium]|nr:MAG: hypothetical protein C4587_00730 [Candidatus Parcubacteria bacterium]